MTKEYIYNHLTLTVTASAATASTAAEQTSQSHRTDDKAKADQEITETSSFIPCLLTSSRIIKGRGYHAKY